MRPSGFRSLETRRFKRDRVSDALFMCTNKLIREVIEGEQEP